MAAKIEFGLLSKADGSASYSYNEYSIIAGVNGPLEVQRRDKLPEESTLEVIVRPAAGVGGIRERHFESIIHKTLRHIIQVKDFPRTLIQVTLQVTASPKIDSISGRLNQASSGLPVLPALLNVACLALLSASIPLNVTLTATIVAVSSNGDTLTKASPAQLEAATSIHVFAFSSHGDLLVVESEGSFDMDSWESVARAARKSCCRGEQEQEVYTQGKTAGTPASLEQQMRNAVEAKVARDESWRHGIDPMQSNKP